MEHTISRIGSSSSTTRIRSAGMLLRNSPRFYPDSAETQSSVSLIVIRLPQFLEFLSALAHELQASIHGERWGEALGTIVGISMPTEGIPLSSISAGVSREWRIGKNTTLLTLPPPAWIQRVTRFPTAILKGQSIGQPDCTYARRASDQVRLANQVPVSSGN